MAPPRLFNVGPRYAAAPTPPIEVERAPAADTLLLGDVALREFAALQREGMRMGSAVFTEVSARDRSASDGMYLKDSVSTTGV